MSKSKIHFEISERKMMLHLVDVLSIVTTLYVVGCFFELDYLKASVSNIVYLTVLVLYLKVIGTIFELYNLQVASNEFQVSRSCILTVTTTVLAYFLTPIYAPELPSNRLQILTFLLVVFFSLVLWRVFYVRFLASNRFHQNVLLICEEEQLDELISGLANIDPHYKITAYVNDFKSKAVENLFYANIERVVSSDLVTYVKERYITEIVVASQKTESITTELYQQLLKLLESGKVIREYSQVYEAKTQRIPMQYVERDFYLFFPFSSNNQNRLYLAIVRVLEIVLSIIGLLITLVLIPFIFLVNAFANKGSLFYTQERVGKDGAVFNILKFRTMIANAEKENAQFATAQDNRITAFGKFMRKTRMDEFPQFVNILKGEMAVIGPRPERPFFVKEIAERMPFYETRHVIKPGLTGWAQVNYSYGESIEESLIKLQYDLYYIKHRSFYLDFNITLKTITTILFYRGQ
ncbi:exopolysaccharide biosynthesis polyprenyl glycosylphosphotransferase [Flavobacterium seoulense]|uniref:Sugar transferase n=1 Tax=Flavobacterium seoulense TaxID=1492738 RepID=A0A066WPQ6_9FLAO|nr:exopolysaccharide biosynthesis polyprenyl glycosylphosphotransferase [Flavobacterium seoulense]KDN56032.1 sugar transferase [Flavobacterium seoulense]